LIIKKGKKIFHRAVLQKSANQGHITAFK